MASGSSLTISVVTGRSPENLTRCLGSIANAAHTVEPVVRVIDNCATFDVESVVAGAWTRDVHISHNRRRRGFAANHNQVLGELSTEFVLVLNDDVVLGDGAVDEMLRVAVQSPETGIVGATLYAGDGSGPPIRAGGVDRVVVPPPVKVCVYYILQLGGLLPEGELGRVDTSSGESDALHLSYVSGACCLLRREMLEQIGGFDEGFYMYFEDIDLGYRARAAGWRCVQARRARVTHLEASSFSPASWGWVLGGARRFADKHHGVCTRILVRLLTRVLGAMIRAKKGICDEI